MTKGRIKRLCDEWVAAMVQSDPEGGYALSIGSDLGLLAHGVSYPDLTLNELREACAGLTKTLLFSGLNTVISEDHLLFWAWAAEVLAGPVMGTLRSEEDQEIATTHGLATRMMLATVHLAQGSPLAFLYAHPRLGPIFTHSADIGAYLSFPFLEAVVKRACRTFVDQDGTVRADFKVRPPGKSNPPLYKAGGRRVSSTRDLMWLFRDGHESFSWRRLSLDPPTSPLWPCS
jgi:hypothetical protein